MEKRGPSRQIHRTQEVGGSNPPSSIPRRKGGMAKATLQSKNKSDGWIVVTLSAPLSWAEGLSQRLSGFR
ncbi:MAG: hypothetical protein COV67_01980 [Nitrospinae bacterium CG11_big_fil_rev_8_21_14_0_20_56_8]|nr:MAG: hypothetical protein COV67_01980 [Nitrospinae bacterium CG11_big_fil_rev_8_21_14_0_20_56_8]